MDIRETLLTTSGRLNRKPYIAAAVALTAAALPFALAGILVDQVWMGGAALLLLMVPAAIVAVKRCHDRDRSGWFLLLALLPIANFWVMIELIFLRGTAGPNRFGPDPLPDAAPAHAVLTPSSAAE